ncbi:MAG: NAD(P)H-dependent oxidoreductase subunit E [Candidatus Dormibacteraeota bacterium]|nr:NAD(P)H-dependent oxidoreductase subunit E [Candidatus Dormibacteraeota bacterium]
MPESEGDASSAALAPGTLQRLRDLRSRYPVARSAVLPALWVVQDELGYLPPWSEEVVAEELGLLPGDVAAVASFYSMYFQHQAGRHFVQVCQNVSCALRGADDLLAGLREWLQADEEGASPDGAFTLEGTVECLGACGGGPMMQVDRYSYEDLTVDSAREILERIRERAGGGAGA